MATAMASDGRRTTGDRVRAYQGAAVLALVVALLQVLVPPAAAAELSGDTLRRDLAVARGRLEATAGRLPRTAYPVRTDPAGAWVTAPASDWTSGFFPGSLWQMYDATKDPVWRQRAEAWQAGIESRKTDNSSHDIGFQIFDSFGKDAALTGDPAARDVVLTAARSLASRYNPKVGATRSWDAVNDPTRFQVIMDNMMNLELLFWASRNGGDPAWADLATTHARTTARDFFRPDGGSWHVVNYDQVTGAVAAKYTHQGFSNDSTWSRGEAWAIHGFATSYRFVKDPVFLATSQKAADYFLSHLPPDKVPYWDFSLPSTAGQPRDSSAAAIAASGLVELSGLQPDAAARQRDLDGARDILAGLSTPAYLADGTPNQAVLLHGTQNKPDGSADTGIMFGDYFFIEALQRYAAATGIPTTAPTVPPTTAPPTTTLRPGTVPPTTTAPAADPVTAYWTKLGGASSYLGQPTAAGYAVAGGRARDYQGGSIYWSQATGAHAVHGSILARYKALGGPAGALAFPVTDEVPTADGRGRATMFSAPGGAGLYWNSTNNTVRSVSGPVRDKWIATGETRGFLGYPTVDLSVTPDGVGRYVHFTGAGGSVYWTPASGAHIVQGAIRARWAQLGWERSSLGYPTTDEYAVTGGRRNDFQQGSIIWTQRTNTIQVIAR